MGTLYPHEAIPKLTWSLTKTSGRPATYLPVPVDPVKPSFAMPLFVARASPASAPNPVTTLMTPGGTMSFIRSIRAMIDVGVCSAGLSTDHAQGKIA